ncbi:hypothetical protein LshimejAT787_1202750 [Lyophyllum shimeji]|uniref:F-box domain-containing protein n=1 Tax=Lyophyllum shimeji TaxID=47721 RepID=A0A9P3PX61_LYOSH|nr:hypothetical protein LshimejAT787_1202750 [Lyophyllum shimeji]
MPFTSFPPELVLKIFHLASLDQPQSYRACLCFIRKVWADIAREILFQHVEIRLRSGMDKSPVSVPRTDFARHIKNLTFRFDNEQGAVAANTAPPPLDPGLSFPDVFAELAEAATSISTLQFHVSFHSFVSFPADLFQTFSLNNITHLTVSGHNGVPVKTIFELCSNLRSLVLDAIFFSMVRHPKTLKLPRRPVTHFHLNVWSLGQSMEAMFQSVSKSITSLSFGVNQSGRLEAALRIVGARLKSLELRRLESEAARPPTLQHLITTITFECPYLERLAFDTDFDWSFTPLNVLLSLPPSLKVLSISDCRDISADIVAALRRSDWLPKLAELRVVRLFGGEGGSQCRAEAMGLCAQRGITIQDEESFMQVHL